MKPFAWLTANTCVMRSVVIKDRNAEVYMPQRSSLACLNLQRLFN